MQSSDHPYNSNLSERPSTWGPLALSITLHSMVICIVFISLSFFGASDASQNKTEKPLPEILSIELIALSPANTLPMEETKKIIQEPIIAQNRPSSKKEKQLRARASPHSSALLVEKNAGQQGVENYAVIVARHILKFRDYPPVARQRHTEGKVVVQISIASNGDLISSQIIESSGSHLLDYAGITTARKASPYPPPQNTNTATTLNIPILFRLKAE